MPSSPYTQDHDYGNGTTGVRGCARIEEGWWATGRQLRKAEKKNEEVRGSLEKKGRFI
jgi:hypothetical protein